MGGTRPRQDRRSPHRPPEAAALCRSSKRKGYEFTVLRCEYPAAQASLPVVEDDVTPAPTAFLSHASEDKADFVEPLGRELADMGIRPWLDKWEIRPGDSLVEKLFDEGVAAVDAVIVVVSQYSAGKPWVRAELDTAVVRRITEGTRLIPVRLDAADMPAPLRMLAWHDADRTEDGIQGAARLIADTIHGLDPRPAVAPPPTYTSAARIPGLTAARLRAAHSARRGSNRGRQPAVRALARGRGTRSRPRAGRRDGSRVPGRAGTTPLRQAPAHSCRRRSPRSGTCLSEASVPSPMPSFRALKPPVSRSSHPW